MGDSSARTIALYALQACKNAKQFEKQSTDMGISVATMT